MTSGPALAGYTILLHGQQATVCVTGRWRFVLCKWHMFQFLVSSLCGQDGHATLPLCFELPVRLLLCIPSCSSSSSNRRGRLP